jgi:hypothetical protein
MRTLRRCATSARNVRLGGFARQPQCCTRTAYGDPCQCFGVSLGSTLPDNVGRRHSSSADENKGARGDPST